MDYTNWPQIQQYPNPNPDYSQLQTPNQPVPYHQNLEIPNQSVVYPQNCVSDGALFMPPPPVAVNYVHQPFIFHAQPVGDAAAAAGAASYYLDPNVSWVAPTPQFGTTPYAAAGVAIQPETIQVRRNLPQKTKVVQSVWCEVCKINCNSKEVLDNHKLGRKHLKNLQKLQAPPIVAAATSASIVDPPTSIAAPPSAITPTLPVPTPVSTEKPFIGPQPKPKNSKKKKRAAALPEDLEVKRRKVLEGGAAAHAVLLCSICNVVCNSDTVFSYHMAGKKHASMAKKHALQGGVASVV